MQNRASGLFKSGLKNEVVPQQGDYCNSYYIHLRHKSQPNC